MRIRKVLAAAMAACLAAGAGRVRQQEIRRKSHQNRRIRANHRRERSGGYQEVLGIRYAREMHPTVNIGGEEYTVKLVEVDNKSDKTELSTPPRSW